MKNKEQRNLIRIDRRGVVQSCVPYVTNNPSRISIFSCSPTRALCLLVCCFSLFVLSLLYVYRFLSFVSILRVNSVFSLALGVSISQFCVLYVSPRLSMCCSRFCATSLYSLHYTHRHVHTHIYMYIYIFVYRYKYYFQI